jgi:hypothetical protein
VRASPSTAQQPKRHSLHACHTHTRRRLRHISSEPACAAPGATRAAACRAACASASVDSVSARSTSTCGASAAAMAAYSRCMPSAPGRSCVW